MRDYTVNTLKYADEDHIISKQIILRTW